MLEASFSNSEVHHLYAVACFFRLLQGWCNWSSDKVLNL